MAELSNAQRALLLAAAQSGSKIVFFEHDLVTCGSKQVHPFPQADLDALLQQGLLRKLTQGSLAYAVTDEGLRFGHRLLAASEDAT